MDELKRACEERKAAAKDLVLLAYKERFGELSGELRQIYQPIVLDNSWDSLLARLDIAEFMNSIDSEH